MKFEVYTIVNIWIVVILRVEDKAVCSSETLIKDYMASQPRWPQSFSFL
jgi:hypothetical protein